MIEPGLLRCKRFCAEHGRIIVASLILVSLLSLTGSVWVYTHPHEVEVTERGIERTVMTDVETRAVVTGETSLWDRGTLLENKPFYPLDPAPNLTVRARTTVPTNKTATVDHEFRLLYRVSKNGEEFWSNEAIIERESVQFQDGAAVSSATINIPSVQDRTSEISSDLDGAGNIDVYLGMNVTYETGSYSGAFTKRVPLKSTGKGYWLGGSLDAEQTHTTTMVQTEERRDTTAILGLLIAGLFAGAGAAAATWFYRYGPDAPTIARQLQEERCREWISQGRIPQTIGGHDIEMESLQDLTDVAIDSGDRVIYDPDRDLYAVVDRDLLYYYDPQATAPGTDFPGWREDPEPLTQVADGGADPGPGIDPDDPGSEFASERWDRLLESDDESG